MQCRPIRAGCGREPYLPNRRARRGVPSNRPELRVRQALQRVDLRAELLGLGSLLRRVLCEHSQRAGETSEVLANETLFVGEREE